MESNLRATRSPLLFPPRSVECGTSFEKALDRQSIHSQLCRVLDTAQLQHRFSISTTSTPNEDTATTVASSRENFLDAAMAACKSV
jgi:hypothetical protein